MKEVRRRSNKNNAARQVVHSCSPLHVIQMGTLNFDSIRRPGANLVAYILQHLESTMSAETTPGICRRIHKGRRDKAAKVSISLRCREAPLRVWVTN